MAFGSANAFGQIQARSLEQHQPVSGMVRAQCPASLRKYGFCGILATVYAAKLPVPSSIAKLEALLAEIKGVLCMKKSLWSRSKPKKTGAISISDTLCLLAHYKACDYEVLRRKTDPGAPTLRAWMKTVRPRTCYIVHVKSHALFVEVGAVRSKWRIYDQSGVHTKEHPAFLERVGGYGRKLVVAVVQITYADGEKHEVLQCEGPSSDDIV